MSRTRKKKNARGSIETLLAAATATILYSDLEAHRSVESDTLLAHLQAWSPTEDKIQVLQQALADHMRAPTHSTFGNAYQRYLHQRIEQELFRSPTPIFNQKTMAVLKRMVAAIQAGDAHSVLISQPINASFTHAQCDLTGKPIDIHLARKITLTTETKAVHEFIIGKQHEQFIMTIHNAYTFLRACRVRAHDVTNETHFKQTLATLKLSALLFNTWMMKTTLPSEEKERR